MPEVRGKHPDWFEIIEMTACINHGRQIIISEQHSLLYKQFRLLVVQ